MAASSGDCEAPGPDRRRVAAPDGRRAGGGDARDAGALGGDPPPAGARVERPEGARGADRSRLRDGPRHGRSRERDAYLASLARGTVATRGGMTVEGTQVRVHDGRTAVVVQTSHRS